MFVTHVPVPTVEVRRGHRFLWNWSYRWLVSYHVDAWNRTQFLCKKSQCSKLLSHRLSIMICFEPLLTALAGNDGSMQ